MIKITILILCISTSFSLFRRDLELSFNFVPQQIAVVNDDTLVVVDKTKILQLNGSNFMQVHKLAMTSNQAESSPSLVILNGKPTFLSGGSINQIIQEIPPLLNYSITYPYTDLSGEMRRQGNVILVPPINYQVNSLFALHLDQLTVQEINYQPNKYGTVGSSNIFYYDGNAYFASVQSFIGAKIYRKNGQNVQYLCTFIDGFLRTETSYSRQIASLDIKPYLDQNYLTLVWQSRYSTFFNINLAKEVDGNFTLYSHMGMQKVVASYLTDRGTIIIYQSKYQQIEQLDPHNPMALNIIKPAVEYYVNIKDISQSQDYFFGVYAYSSTGFALPGYLYQLNDQQIFQKNREIGKSSNGTGFGSGIFVGNDEYIAILEQQIDNSLQISIYSMELKNFIEEYAIKGVHNYSKNEGSFCSCSNSSFFFVVTVQAGKFYLKLYSFESGILQIKDSITINGSSQIRTSMKCVGNDTFIWAVFNSSQPYMISLTSFRATDGLIKQTNSVQRLVSKNSYSLRAVIGDVFIIMNTEYDPILFYNKDLSELNLTFDSKSSRNILHIISIETYRGNHILIRTDYSFQLWSLIQTQLMYLGSYPLIYNNDPNDEGHTFARKILLPKMNLLILDFIVFSIDKPPQRRIGYATGDDYRPSNFYFYSAKFFKKDNSLYLVASWDMYDLFKLLITETSVTQIERIYIPLNKIQNIRLSSDEQWVIIINADNSYMIVNASNIRNVQSFSNMQYPTTHYYLKDLDYITQKSQIVSIAKIFPDKTNIAYLNILISFSNINKMMIDFSITSVSFVTFGKQIFVYSGLDSNNNNATFFILQDILQQSQPQSYEVNCSIQLLAINPSQTKIAGVCSNQSIFIFLRQTKEVYYLNIEGQISKLSFLSEEKLIINLNGQLIILPIGKTSPRVGLKSLDAALKNSTFTIDYANNILVYQTSTAIRIVNSQTQQIINEIGLYRQLQILSLAFNPTGDILYASLQSNRSSYSQFNTYTSRPCPDNQTLDTYYFYCICKDTFIRSNSSCVCPGNLVVLDNSTCGCKDVYILWNTLCYCPQYYIQVDGACICTREIINGSCQCPNNQIYIQQKGACGCQPSHLTVNSSCICPNNLIEMSSGVCSCKSPFTKIDNFCVCQDGKGLTNDNTSCRYCSSNEQLINSYCQCKVGYVRFQNSTICDSCSFICQECNSSQAFDCKDYSAGFYVIVCVSGLIIVSLSLLIIKKCRSKKKQQSQLTDNVLYNQ